jgi:hypothetical protein
MSDHVVDHGCAVLSRMLTARAADLAITLAGVVERHGSADAGADRTAAFLRDWAGTCRTDVVFPPSVQPLDRVAGHFGLGRPERELLLLAGLPEEHEGMASTFRALSPRGEPHLSVGLAALVLAGSGVDRIDLRGLLSSGAAVRHGLVQLSGSDGLFGRSVVLADRLWDALHGADAFPLGLARVAVGDAVAGLDGWLADPESRRAARLLRDGGPVTLLVPDADEPVALSRCAALAASVGAGLLAARSAADDTAAIRLLAVHAAARGAVPLVVVAEQAEAGRAVPLAVADLPGPVIVCARSGSVAPDPVRPVLVLPLTPAPVVDRRTAWRVALPGVDDTAAADLAARHPIDPARIAQVGRDARVGGRTGPAAVGGLIRRRCALSLPVGVGLCTPAVPWRRLVLPEAAALQLHDAVSRLQHQAVVLDDWGMRGRARASRGARLLFTGPPGTGKSLAAEAVATAAATDLLRVDVSRMVSKWIGETEKNLAGAFDVAEQTQAVLLLDEADALFGSRTQISDAHDRYANQETAYLLQRLDGFEGLMVLTTNLRHNVDPAFLRRLDFVVDFPLPDSDGRRDLWSLHLPPEQMDPDVDLEVLARLYPMPGGWIRNAAVAAAFVAASTGDRIRQAHLVASVRREYEKAPLPFPGEPPRRRDDI